MKKRLILFAFAFSVLCATAQQTQVPAIKPRSVVPMPKISVAEWNELCDKFDVDEGEYDEKKFGDLTVYTDFYSSNCSWYCAGDVKKITASSCLPPYKSFTYNPANAHDFNHESVWATKGKGVGEYLLYTFEGRNPRITTVKILNGHVKSEAAWRANSRVKKMRIWFNENPYLILELEDSRTLQIFDVGTLGYNDTTKPDWTLKFEILEVYPGAKFDDTVIAELYFDGIDVH